MANRTNKPTTKQTAATRRTKKKPTPVKTVPVKKTAAEKPKTATEKPKTAKSGNPIKVKTPKKVVKTEVTSQNSAISGNEKPKKTRVVRNKASEFVRLAANAKREDFRAMGERIRCGEIQWAYYAVDGNIGYHYYLILT